ncbi:MAG: hypothetical protein JSR38_07400 [Proteobacteria bacterium]|nr:hypothetical protein [Pseudomonadota bacterium]
MPGFEPPGGEKPEPIVLGRMVIGQGAGRGGNHRHHAPQRGGGGGGGAGGGGGGGGRGNSPRPQGQAPARPDGRRQAQKPQPRLTQQKPR